MRGILDLETYAPHDGVAFLLQTRSRTLANIHAGYEERRVFMGDVYTANGTSGKFSQLHL